MCPQLILSWALWGQYYTTFPLITYLKGKISYEVFVPGNPSLPTIVFLS